MSHNRRHIIIDGLRPTFEDPEVREVFTVRQKERIDKICASHDPTDEDFRYLSRRLTQAYCNDD